MLLLVPNQNDQQRSNVFALFGPMPFFLSGVNDGVNPYGIVAVVLFSFLLNYWAGSLKSKLLGGVGFLLVFLAGIYWIKLDYMGNIFSTRENFQMGEYLSYGLAALCAILGIMLLRVKQNHIVTRIFPGASEQSLFRARWPILLCFFGALGGILAFWRTLYPSPMHLEAMISTLWVQREVDELNNGLFAYALGAIVPIVTGLVLVAFIPETKSLQEPLIQKARQLRVGLAAIFLSLSAAIIYLMQQPFIK